MSETSEQMNNDVDKTITMKDTVQIRWSRSDQYRIDLMKKSIVGDVYHAKTFAKDFCVAGTNVTLTSLSDKVEQIQNKTDVENVQEKVENIQKNMVVVQEKVENIQKDMENVQKDMTDNNEIMVQTTNKLADNMFELRVEMEKNSSYTIESVDRAHKDINHLKERMSEAEDRLERNDRRWEDNDERWEKYVERADERLGELQERFTDMNRDMNQRCDGISERCDDLSESVKTIREGMEKNSEENDERWKEMDRRVAQLEADKERITKIEYVLEKLMTSMEKNAESVDEKVQEAVNGMMEKFEEKLKAVISDTNKEIDTVKDSVWSNARKVEQDMLSKTEETKSEFDGKMAELEKQSETINNVVLPSIRGLAVDVKELKEAYNADLIRVERDSTNRFDTMAADLVHKIDNVRSDVLANTTEMNDFKYILENVNNDVKEIKNMFDKDTVVFCCD